MCWAQPCLEKQVQKLGQQPARPEVDPRVRLSAKTEGKRTAEYHWEHWRTESQMGRRPAQHHMARWWQTGTLLLFLLHSPALWPSVYSYPWPRGKATTPALHAYGSGTKGLWGLSCILFSFMQLTGLLREDNWLQWHSTYLYFPEHLLTFNKHSTDSNWIKKSNE